MKILITGGSGLIGKALAQKLHQKGYEIGILGRNSTKSSNSPYRLYSWDIESGYIEKSALENCNFIVHLAGANISDKRWTKKQKLIIEDSRVKSARILFDACKEQNIKLKAFISSSAIGYYGTYTSEKILTEEDGPGNDFLSEIGIKWEKASDLFQNEGIRTVKIRTGVVLSNLGAAYVKMSKAVKFGVGSAFGSGNQYIPWIHINDIVSIFVKAIEDENMIGVYNGVAPNNLKNKELIAAIAKNLKKPFWLPNIPSFIIRMIFGEMSDILLKGTRISAEKIVQQGFLFQFPDIETALNDLSRLSKSNSEN